MVKRILSLFRGKNKKKVLQPVITPRSKHGISRKNISPNALKVLYRLKDAGFAAYLVGGGVRDLLLGLHPKDFDIATDALPEQVYKLFRNCILIGRRFRLAHVRFGREVIEVATFRACVQSNHDSEKHKKSEHGMILRDNVYGTLEDDVWRRDFTVNALYYNIKDFSVVDYTGGMKDLKNKRIHMIGDPMERYREDPVRMLRAVRLAAKLGFEIAKKTAEPIDKLVSLFENVSPARLFEEVAKWFSSGKSFETFNLLRQYKLFSFLFAQTSASLLGKKAKITLQMLHQGFANTDKRISEGKTLNPAFLYAVLLWWPLQEQISSLQKSENLSEMDAMHKAVHMVLGNQKKYIAIPQRLIFTIKDIWVMQYQFASQKKRQIYYLLSTAKFRAAYDFLLLRASAGEKVVELAAWWTKLQNADDSMRHEMIAKISQEDK